MEYNNVVQKKTTKILETQRFTSCDTSGHLSNLKTGLLLWKEIYKKTQVYYALLLKNMYTLSQIRSQTIPHEKKSSSNICKDLAHIERLY